MTELRLPSANERQWLWHSRIVVACVGNSLNDLGPVVAALDAEGVVVRAYCRGADALIELGHRLPDVVLIRAALHDVDLEVWTRAVRRRSAVPVLVATSEGEAELAGPGLLAGATTLVSYPYSPEELLDRLGQLQEVIAARRGSEGTLRHGGLSLNLAAFSARYRGRELELPLKELELLHVLMLNVGRVVSADEIVAHLWGPPPRRISLATLKSHVRRLRTLIGDDTTIRTVRGQGYTLAMAAWDEV